VVNYIYIYLKIEYWIPNTISIDTVKLESFYLKCCISRYLNI